MPLGSAHRLAPEATFLDPEPEADAASVDRALEALAAFSPGVAGTTDSADPAFGLLEVQVDGLERLWGLEPVLVERIVEALAPILPGLPRVGIAGTRFAATTAAGAAETPGRPWIVEPGGEAAFLAPFPVALLTPDPDVRARLARFGLRRIESVAELPRSSLVARFGPEGGRIHARANGQEIAAFRPYRAPERLALGLGLEPPVEGLEPLRFVLHRLAGALADQLLARGAAAGRVELRIGLDPAFARTGTPIHLAIDQRFPEPTAEGEAIERLLLARLEREPPPAAVARLELELAEVAPASGQQLALFVPQAVRTARLGWQLARLALTFGEDRIGRVELADPEAALPETRWRRLPIGSGSEDGIRPLSPGVSRPVAVTPGAVR
jgi:impB/mucB/samB family C-terminal domain